jgi:hypothetical protein
LGDEWGGEERGKWPVYGGVTVVGIVFAGEREGHDADTKQKRGAKARKKKKKKVQCKIEIEIEVE